jgi:hypothetical protein
VWTVLVAVGLHRSVFRGSLTGRIVLVTGTVSAALIAVGIVEPFDVPGAGLANFAGYVVWSGWLVALAVIVLRGTGRPTTAVPTNVNDAPTAADAVSEV